METIRFIRGYFRRNSLDFIKKFHVKLFGHEMSGSMLEFLGNLSWSFFGGIGAGGVMFLTNILAGRWLGPLGYGKYNYLLSFALSSMFVFLLGNNSSGVRFISDVKYKKEKNSILTAALMLSLIQAILLLLIVIIFKRLLIERYNVESNAISLIFIFGLILSFKDLLDSFLRALNLIKKQSFIKIVDAMLVCISFVTFIYLFENNVSYAYYIYAFLSGGMFSIASSFYLIKRNIAKFSRKHIYLILHYNKFLILCSFSAFILGLDKIFLGKYVGIKNLGIYSAYYASSQLVISNLALIFMNIFWPAVIKNKISISVILIKIDKLIYKFFIVFLLLNFASISFFICLFGKEYPFSLFLVALFSLSSILNIVFYLFISILNIDHIGQSVLVTSICYLTMVSSIAIFKSVPVYLIFQIVIYAMGILYIRNKLK